MSAYSVHALHLIESKKKATRRSPRRGAPTRPTTVRVPAPTRALLDDLMLRTGRDFSSTVNEVLDEGLRVQRIPGIVFADGPAGRRARVAGTGLDVFEIVRAFEQLRQDWETLRKAYGWLNEVQLRAALAYAAAYPQEIAERLARKAMMDEQQTHHLYPFTAPDLSGWKR